MELIHLCFLFIIAVILIFAYILYSIYKQHRFIEEKTEQIEFFGGEAEAEMSSSVASRVPASSSVQLPKEIKDLISVKWPQVSVLTNSILATTSLEQYYYSEKTDGIHRNLLIYEGVCFDVSLMGSSSVSAGGVSREPVKLFELDFKPTLILDCEEYNSKYFIFDVYYADDKCLNEETFVNRMAYARAHISELGPMFVLKEFKPIPSFEFLSDYIENDISPDTGNEIDGVILQRIDLPYIWRPPKDRREEATVLKYKPRSLLSVDFELIYEPSTGAYSLYSIGSCFQFLDSLTSKPRTQSYVYDADSNCIERSLLKRLPESMLILFDSPFIPNLSQYNIDKQWNTAGFFTRTRNQADALIHAMANDPSKYDKKIVEMSLTLDNKWVPIRVRDDKLKPNGFKVAQSVVACIFDSIKKPEELYFQKQLTASTTLQTLVHEINAVFRKYIIENELARANYGSIIDLCGGRGADEFNLYSNGYNNFFAIDADTTALKQYVDRSYYLKQKAKNAKYTPFRYPWNGPKQQKSGSSKQRTPVGNKNCYRTPAVTREKRTPAVTINALHHILSSNYKPIIEDLKSRADFKSHVDAVLMNYAIHYICNAQKNITALATFVSSMLEKGGRFVFTYFDGDEIERRAKDGVAQVGPFEIKLRKEKSSTIASMPLMTIQNTGYRDEPLVHARMLSALDRKLKFINEYSVYDKSRAYVDKLNRPQVASANVAAIAYAGEPSREDLFSALIEYYKLIKVRVYEKV